MPIDNTIFRDFFRLRERQRAERNTHNPPLNHPVPTFGTFDGPSESRTRPGHRFRVDGPSETRTRPRHRFRVDGPSETRTRPRHHFRRGAISEASRLPILPAADGAQALAQQGIRIRSITENEIEIILSPFPSRQQRTNNSASQTQGNQWRELADRIHRGLVNINSPAIQEQINAAVATLHSPTSPIRSRPAMENNSTVQHRDTRRYGREGWWTVENEPAANQRPATIPGSSFAVPSSTLNLFQSVDLFAPTSPRITENDYACLVNMQVARYAQQLETVFNIMVAERRRGCVAPKGRLFLVSMELSRVRQLKSILEDESFEFVRAEREASRRDRSGREGRRDSQGRSNEETLEQTPDMASDDESSISDGDAPEGWANLDFVFDGDYPEELCFHIGSQAVTFPIEEVEQWMMDERRRERWAAHTPRQSSGTQTGQEPYPAHQDARRILHTLAMPEVVRSTYLRAGTTASDDYGDESEADEGSYDPYDRGDGDIPDSEYGDENGEEDDGDETEEDFDHEGWGEPAAHDSQETEQISRDAEGGVQSQGAPAHMSVIDLAHSPPPAEPEALVPMVDLSRSPAPPESYIRSQNTSDESNPTTVTSSEQEDEPEFEAPHPVHGWTFDHSLFMFSCRGNIFDVTRQLQHAFGFAPEVNPHMVGERLNGEFAARHHSFILTFLPGEEGINIRASRRDSLHQRDSSHEDVYYGTQDIAEGDVGREGYAPPPLPRMAPDCWHRTLDICLLQHLHRGKFSFETFWRRHQATLGGTHFSAELRGFLGIRLAQVRYLGITEEEL